MIKKFKMKFDIPHLIKIGGINPSEDTITEMLERNAFSLFWEFKLSDELNLKISPLGSRNDLISPTSGKRVEVRTFKRNVKMSPSQRTGGSKGKQRKRDCKTDYELEKWYTELTNDILEKFDENDYFIFIDNWSYVNKSLDFDCYLIDSKWGRDLYMNKKFNTYASMSRGNFFKMIENDVENTNVNVIKQILN